MIDQSKYDYSTAAEREMKAISYYPLAKQFHLLPMLDNHMHMAFCSEI